MSININEVPATVKELSDEIIKLADATKKGDVSGEEAARAVQSWKKFVPSIFFKGEEINPAVVKIIGKRRAAIINMLLKAQ